MQGLRFTRAFRILWVYNTRCESIYEKTIGNWLCVLLRIVNLQQAYGLVHFLLLHGSWFQPTLLLDLTWKEEHRNQL